MAENILELLLITLLALFLGAFGLMTLMMLLNSQFEAVPAIGYWYSFGLIAFSRVVVQSLAPIQQQK